MKISFKGIKVDYRTTDGKRNQFNSDKLSSKKSKITALITQVEPDKFMFICRADNKYQNQQQSFKVNNLKSIDIESIDKGTKLLVEASLKKLNIKEIDNALVKINKKMKLNVGLANNLQVQDSKAKITGKNLIITI